MCEAGVGSSAVMKLSGYRTGEKQGASFPLVRPDSLRYQRRQRDSRDACPARRLELFLHDLVIRELVCTCERSNAGPESVSGVVRVIQ
jgi:hypothetical protein